MKNKVMTVRGMIDPNDMGVTDAHNHVWISQVENAYLGAPILDQYDAILLELRDYVKAGGASQIDCQPFACGRDARKLRLLAEETGVNIVASTGFHLQHYYPPDNALWNMDVDAATHFFLSEINQGLTESMKLDQPVRAGQIKIAVESDMQSSSRKLMEAAALASLESSVLISMHTEKGRAVEDFINFFAKQGLPSEKLMICHIDKRPDIGLHMELAQAGYLLEYDTFLRPKYEPEKNLWPLLEKMIAAGMEKSLALATDLADGSLWANISKGPGLAAFITHIKNKINNLGYSREIIDAISGGNIASRLAISSEAGSL